MQSVSADVDEEPGRGKLPFLSSGPNDLIQSPGAGKRNECRENEGEGH